MPKCYPKDPQGRPEGSKMRTRGRQKLGSRMPVLRPIAQRRPRSLMDPPWCLQDVILMLNVTQRTPKGDQRGPKCEPWGAKNSHCACPFYDQSHAPKTTHGPPMASSRNILHTFCITFELRSNNLYCDIDWPMLFKWSFTIAARFVFVVASIQFCVQSCETDR